MLQSICNYTITDFRIKTRSAKKYSMTTHHFHESYEIYYMNSGSRQYFINDRTYNVASGSLVLIGPNVLHKTMDTGEEHSRILMSFKNNFLPVGTMKDTLDQIFNNHSVIHFPLINQAQIEEILDHIIHEANTQELGFLTSIKSYLLQLLVLSSRYRQQCQLDDLQINPSNQKIQEVIKHLQLHYSEPITLDQLAETYFISRYYLSRLFKKVTGFSFIEYLHSLRVVEAQRLLRDTNLKVIEIASKTGFSNVSNFGKVFKSITKITPLAYRKKVVMMDTN